MRKMPPKPHPSYCRTEAGGECLPPSQHTTDSSLKLTVSPKIYLPCAKGSPRLRELLHLVRPTPPYGEGSEEGQKMHGLRVGALVSSHLVAVCELS